METEADLVGSATLVAVTEWEPGEVEVEGENKPEEEMEPEVELPPEVPSTDQVTPRFCESLVTVAVNCNGCVRVTAPRFGLRETVTPEVEAIVVADATFE